MGRRAREFTTLGEALGAALGLPYFDSDAYFWTATDPPLTERRPPAARDARLAHDLAQQESWVLGGSIGGWDAQWLRAPFSLVVFLYLPPALRLHRPRQREQPASHLKRRFSGMGRRLRRQQHGRHPYPGQPRPLAGRVYQPGTGTARRPAGGHWRGSRAGQATAAAPFCVAAPAASVTGGASQRTLCPHRLVLPAASLLRHARPSSPVYY